ncbi:PEP-CTERM sorting domain-containing protein [Dapis sp. BLCC M126]|uniref:PEP-CTERM sorting domain-containing protein n=1 Tax=Dapis sp. BLCC M126 TaxID=3400189 RepID=UPI003CF6A88E
MKSKLSIFLTAIAGGLISAMPAQAASFNNSGIFFEEETEVDFQFLGAYNYWQSKLGILNVDTGVKTILFEETQNTDGSGGPDNQNLSAISTPQTSYTFAADTEYSLFLRSLTPDGENPFAGSAIENVNTIFSTDTLNPGWFNVVTGGTGRNPDGTYTIGVGPDQPDNLNQYDSTENSNSTLSLNGRDDLLPNGQRRSIFINDLLAGDVVNILFEDSTPNGSDNDFDDFVFTAQLSGATGGGVLSEVASTPEPATLAGLGMVAGAMFLSRSRKKQH